MSLRNTISDITPEMLGALGDRRAVQVFRELLWAQARRTGIPVTRIHISEKTDVADGGVDAIIEPGATHVADELLTPGTSFQIKAGATCKPWTKSWVENELFGGKAVNRENLASRVRACVEERRRYVLVCFGIDPTPDAQLPKACAVITSILRDCGFQSPRVEVWGQSHLIGLLQPYLSIRLAISGRSDFAFHPHEMWSRRPEMQPTLHTGDEQARFIEDIRGLLRGDSCGHLHISGEAGSGKSRLVFDALSAPDLCPVAVYVDDGQELVRSALLRTIIRDEHIQAILIVDDNCGPNDRASLWNQLKPVRARIRLITLDHSRGERPTGECMTSLDVPPLSDKLTAEIISDYISHPWEALRWARSCSGSPRYAHLIGQNLKNNPHDILREPDTVAVWDRVICGQDDRASHT